MNICWEILGIEPTTDLECIRQAYLALLPSFHPESDPQGFKRLRQAYEEAQHWAASPAEDAKTEEVGDEHEILVAFRELLASERDRFQPSAWQKFIQQLNQCSMDEIDKLRWQLCDIAMKTETISLSCLALLAQRLNWQPQEADDDAEGEELEAFIARRWQAAEPDNEDAHYYLCKQRLLCGEGESLLADLCDFWQRYPSTQADDLLLGWCRQHRPDFFPLAVMAVEARCMADAEYVPGESARTRLLWADILHSGRLSPLGRSFVDSLFYKRKAMAWANSRLSTQGEPETPLLDLYRTAEQVVLEAFPKEKPFFRLLIRLEEGQACPLEALITQALSSKIAMKPGDIRDKKELAEELRLAAEKKLSSEAKTEAPRQTESGGVMKIMKIVGLIALIVCALNRFFHFF